MFGISQMVLLYNFKKLASGIGTEIALPEFGKSFRITHPESPHRHAEDVLIRFNAMPEAGDELSVLEDDVMIDYLTIPAINDIVELTKKLVGGKEVGRVMLSKLPEGKMIYAHADTGSYAEKYKRYHFCITAEDCLFRSGNEIVKMMPGEIWWFNNLIEHELFNRVADRVHLIMDIK